MSTAKLLLKIAGAIVWCAAALGVAAHWASASRTEIPVPVQQDDPRFTGVSTAMEATGLSVSRRRFEPGARSAWHHHDHGQLLYVEEGRARTQKRGEAMKEMGPGESDYTAPRVEHWHGAAPHEHFIQVAVGFGSGITWLEKTTDAQYNGTAR